MKERAEGTLPSNTEEQTISLITLSYIFLIENLLILMLLVDAVYKIDRLISIKIHGCSWFMQQFLCWYHCVLFIDVVYDCSPKF